MSTVMMLQLKEHASIQTAELLTLIQMIATSTLKADIKSVENKMMTILMPD